MIYELSLLTFYFEYSRFSNLLRRDIKNDEKAKGLRRTYIYTGLGHFIRPSGAHTKESRQSE